MEGVRGSNVTREETGRGGGAKCRLLKGLHGTKALRCPTKEDRGCRLTLIMQAVTWKHLHLTGQHATGLFCTRVLLRVFQPIEAGSCSLLQKDACAC